MVRTPLVPSSLLFCPKSPTEATSLGLGYCAGLPGRQSRPEAIAL